MAECKSCRYYIPDGASICGNCGADQRKILGPLWKIVSAFTTIITIIVGIVVIVQAFILNSQTDSLKKQTDILKETFDLEKRPYLYVDIQPFIKGYDTKGNFHAGASIKYKNVGSYVASDIQTEVKIADDGDGDKLFDIAEWYVKEHSSYPYITTVFPQQDNEPHLFTPNMSDFPLTNKKYVYCGVRIKYIGFNKKKYFYDANLVYMIEKDPTSSQFMRTVLKDNTSWDMNEKSSWNEIKAPDWDIYRKNK